MDKKNKILPLFVIVCVWGILAACCFLKPDGAFSASERRRLTQKPEYEMEDMISGKYFSEFEAYVLDQFPLRDWFRTGKAVSEYYLLGKSDNNGIYISDGYAVKAEYPMNEDSVRHAAEKFDELYRTYVQGKSEQVYLSLIPDKGYFMGKESGHPVPDYDAMFQIVREEMPYANYIDTAAGLELTDYYKTDTHWRQENLTELANVFAKEMDIELSGKYEMTEVERPFYGVYYGQAALPLKADTIRYLSNDVLASCSVYNEETKKTTGLYDIEKLESRDMYEVYLSGAAPLLYIENPHAEEKRELVVFRDSFASAFVPLLAEGYSRITLVDTRYMQPDAVGDYVDFENAEVLFLYSVSLLHNSQSLR